MNKNTKKTLHLSVLLLNRHENVKQLIMYIIITVEVKHQVSRWLGAIQSSSPNGSPV